MTDDTKKSEDTSWVLDVAKLSRIKLTPEEEKKFTKQLGAVLENFEVLNKVDTAKVEITAQVTGLSDVFRSDEIKNVNNKESRDKLLSNVPEVENGSIKVPEVFSS
jgi:aspartyl-tRNA(Asn)/glutamyl-tRNA(Gln) amidotransferase subunit C